MFHLQDPSCELKKFRVFLELADRSKDLSQTLYEVNEFKKGNVMLTTPFPATVNEK